MKETEAKQMNTTALAYLGDAVYEVAVRSYLLETGQSNADRLHRMAVPFVRAEGQALAVKELLDSLEESEQRLVKRARNRRTTSKPKNVEPVTYKWATAFEALIGYLYLSGQQQRLEWVIDQTVNIIHTMGADHVKRKEKDTE